jgi:hypothetical protein
MQVFGFAGSRAGKARMGSCCYLLFGKELARDWPEALPMPLVPRLPTSIATGTLAKRALPIVAGSWLDVERPGRFHFRPVPLIPASRFCCRSARDGQRRESRLNQPGRRSTFSPVGSSSSSR